MATQQFKALNLREVFNRALRGQPINCHINNLYDLDSSDIDDEVDIVDDFSDDLQVIGYVINDIEDKHMSKFIESKMNKTKGGINDETPSENEQTPPLPQE